jgi:hypothetical protein
MDDKLIRGILSGLIGSIAKDILGVILLYVVKLTTVSYWDYAGLIIFLREPKGIAEHLFSTFVQFLFGMFLGAVYAYLSPLLRCRYYLIKGAAYGILVWFVISVAILVFKLNIEGHAALNTAVANSLTAAVYGVVMAAADFYLGKEAKPKK